MCVYLMYSVPVAKIEYENLFFTATFISPPKHAKSILLAVNDTVGRVNDVYLLLDASILKFLENRQVSVTDNPFPNWVTYGLMGLGISIFMYCMIVEVNTDIKTFNVECPICLEFPCDVVMKCRHAFHFECIELWLLHKPLCPLCKTFVV